MSNYLWDEWDRYHRSKYAPSEQSTKTDWEALDPVDYQFVCQNARARVELLKDPIKIKAAIAVVKRLQEDRVALQAARGANK